MSGTAGGQAITMAAAPIITRLYGPEAFGLLGTFIAILAIVTPLAALTYPIAIILPKQDVDAKGLAKLSIILAVFMSLMALIIIWTTGDWAAAQLGAVDISQYLWLIPFAMLFSALHQVMEQWLIRHMQFKVVAKASVLHSIALNTAKAGAGLYYPLAMALIIFQAVASGLHALLLWVGMKNSLAQERHGKNAKNLRRLAKEYRDFPIFRAPEMTINAASQGLPVLMLAALFGPASAGYYTLGRTVMGIPAGLIGKSVGDVFYPRISEASKNGEPLYPLVLKATLSMAAVGFLPFALVAVTGPWIFSFVFGSEWAIAGDYARWLAVWMFFMFINNPSVKVIPVLKAQAFQLIYTVITLMARIAALYFAFYWYRNDVVAITFFGITGAVVNIILIAIVLKKSKKHDLKRLKYD
jgi:O-antigen/teichoic acid export membrane protein